MHRFPSLQQFQLYGLNVDILVTFISNHVQSKMSDEIIYLFPNFSGAAFEVSKQISNFISNFIMDVITCPLIQVCKRVTDKIHCKRQRDNCCVSASVTGSKYHGVQLLIGKIFCKMLKRSTWWNHQQCCWFLYVETCNFGETNPQYRVPEIACQVTHVLMT